MKWALLFLLAAVVVFALRQRRPAVSHDEKQPSFGETIQAIRRIINEDHQPKK